MAELNNFFPSELAPDSEKNGMEFGLSVGRGIEQEWFQRYSGGGVRYYDLQEEFHRLRRYGRGEQSIRKYKDEFKTDGDLSYINLDWKPVPIIPKFLDIVVNGMDSRLFDVEAKSIDPIASKERGKEANKLERDMIVKQYAGQLMQATGETGLNLNVDEIPDNKEELELHMQINYKQGIEIAEEQAIDFVMEKNEYRFLRKRLLKDLATIGISAARHRFNTADGITLDYVDPARLVWSHTEDPYFRDCYYWGELRTVSISQLIKEFPHLSDKELKEIVDNASTKENYPGIYFGNEQSDENDDNLIQLLYFTFKTFNNSVYKKKQTPMGGEKMIKKDDTFNPPADKRTGFDKIQTTREVLYEGCKVIKADILLSWNLMENMVRPKADTTKVTAPYVVHAPSMYKGRIEGLCSRMTPYADLIQLTHLKLQQHQQKQVPDGVFLDVDSLLDIDLGNGVRYDPREALNMYFQTGSIVGRTMSVDGDPNRNPQPIQPISGNNGGDKIQSSIGLYNHYLNMMRDVTGLNEASDGSTPSEYALPGVQKLAAANSNTATRHILDGANYITKKLAEGISVRLSDVLEFSNTRDELIQSIGKFNTANLKDISKLHLHNFGIFIQIHPDEEEKERLNQDISIALGNGEIGIEDKIDIQQLHNLKQASQLLKLRKKKRQQKAAEAQQQQAQAEAQAEQQAAQAMLEAEAQKFTVEAEAKISVEEAKHGFGMEKLQAEVAAKKELMREEAMYNKEIAQLNAQGAADKFQKGEDAKDARQREQASQNSKMIEQRNTKGPAQDFQAQSATPSQAPSGGSGGGFESSNDTLAPVGDLSEFEPR